jgi:signal transduction histidine kinase
MAYYGANIPKRVGDRTVFIQVARYVDHPDVITDNVVAEFLRRIVWVVFPLMVLLIAVDFAIVRRALRPVKAASNLAQSIGPSRLDQRIPTDGIPNEILALVNAFNQALERLERGFRLQREFTADAAHELRTPLSICG